MGKPAPHEGELTKFEMSGPEKFGRAELVRERSGLFHLGTSREADGSVLTCTFSFRADSDLEWALSVWRAIRHS